MAKKVYQSGRHTVVSEERKWSGKPALAFLVRASVYVVPIVASILFSIWLSKRLPEPESVWQLMGWWAAIIAGSTGVLFVVDRLARRLLPLAALLQMTMVFPDRSPSRFRTAMRSGSSIKNLKAQIAAAAEADRKGDASSAAEIILQLSSALNAHDPQTRGHSERVRAYTEMLAEELGVSEENRAKLRWSSLLHDIGKLQVSAEILNKPGKLNDDEWLEIKRHPTYGIDLAGPLVEWLGEWAGAIEDHHERFDGFGYPNGKAGEAISLGGRIVAVADAYDVMTTARSYKKPMPGAAAREELARHAGAQFDPDVVRAFLELAMGRLRWIAGPLSWLAQLPFLRFAGGVQNIGTSVGVAAAATTGAAAALAGGLIDIPNETLALPPPPQALVDYEGTPPVLSAAGDAFAVDEGSRRTLDLLANDNLIDGSELGIIVEPGFGTVIINADGTVTYIPDDGYSGTDTFTYEVVAPDGSTSTATVTVTVDEVNDLPVLADDSVTVDEDGTIVIDVLANDVDEEGFDLATLAIGTSPLNGVASVAGSMITYVPNPDYNGSDGFTYTVRDTWGELGLATVTIRIEPVNDRPIVPGPGRLAVNDGDSVSFNPLAGASDIDGDLLTMVAYDATSAFGGTVVEGSLIYTAPINASGHDTFGYRVSDGTVVVPVTVRVSVNDVNYPPVFGGSPALTVDENMPGTVDVLGGASDRDGDPITIGAIDTTSTAGTVVDNGDGTITYTPALNWAGTDAFTVDLTDGENVVPVLITVTVNDTNADPLVTPPEPTTEEDTVVVVDLLAGASDPDGDALTLVALDVSGTVGTVVDNGDGTVTYTPPADYNGADTFGYSISDGWAATSATVAVTVTPVNDDPVIDTPPTPTTAEDTALTVDLLAGASDVDGDPLSIAALDLAGTFGTVVDNGDGTVTYAPPSNFNGTDGFGYTLTDGIATVAGSVAISVVPVADIPVLDLIADQTVNELSPATFTATASDGDGDPLTFSLDGAPFGAVIDGGSGVFVWTPAEAQGPGSFAFDVVVKDGDANEDRQSVTITVDEVNVAPTLEPVAPLIMAEAATLTINPVASDVDLPANTLTFSLIGAPAGMTIDPGTGEVTWSNGEPDGPASYSFDIVVTDDGVPSLSAATTVDLLVLEVNQFPVLQPIGDQAVNEGETVDVALTATDADLPVNALSFSLSGAPAFASLTDNGDGTGFLRLAPSFTDSGTYSITITVADDGTPNLTDEEIIEVVVGDVNRPPVIVDQVFGVDENSGSLVVVGSPVASDPDPADTLLYAITGVNPGFVIDSGTGVITVGSVVLDYETATSYAITVQVTDDGVPVLSDSATVTINVNDLNEAPVIVDQVFGVDENSGSLVVVGSPVASDPDPADTLLYAITGVNPGFVIDSGTGVITVGSVVLDYETATSYAITVQVTDDGVPVLSDSATVTINVNDLNEAPVIVDQVFGVDENSGSLVVVGSPVASDPDPADTLLYAITGVNPGFVIDSGTGVITVGSVVLDYETATSYAITVQVTDDGVPVLSDSATVTINVNDLNEAPVIVDQVFGVDENSGSLVVVGSPVASDPDPADTLLYAITGVNPGFVIDSGTGVITVGSVVLDYETATSYAITVQVTDDGVPVLSDSATVTINVNDLNEAPVIVDQVFGVDENSGSLVVVGSPVASDPDPADTLLYAITGVNPGFVIDSGTGVITVGSVVLDYETATSYAITVQVTDDGVPVLSDSATVTINVNDLNEAPVIVDQVFGVDENSGSLVVVGSPVASDPDPADTLLYAITGVNPGFVIDSGTGVITVGSVVLDYETATSYAITVQVTDDGVPVLSDSATVTINVNDLNEAPVIVDQSFGVLEESAPGTLIGTVAASDEDPADTLGYTISGPNPGFALDPSNGELTVDTIVLDYETTTSYTITVQVTDDGVPVLNDTATITINVLDVLHPPVASNDGYTTNKNSALVVAAPGVLRNDSDEDGDPLTVDTTPVTAPTDGVLSLGADGSFTYTPNLGFVGTDTFAYRIDDGAAGIDTATVSIVVDDGVTTDGLYLTSTGSGAEFEFSSTPEPNVAPVPDYDGDSNPGFTIRPSNGDPNESDPQKYQLWTLQPTVPLTLNGPVSLELWSTAEGFDDDQDIDLDLAIFECASDGTDCNLLLEYHEHVDEWNGGVSDWVFRTFDLGSLDVAVLPTRRLEMKLMFGHKNVWVAMAGENPGETSRLLLTEINAPPVANDDVAAVGEDDGVTDIDVVVNDLDINLDPGTVVVIGGPGAARAGVPNPITGEIPYTAAGSFESLAAGVPTVDMFTYEVCDTSALCDTATVSVTVTGANDAPVAANDGPGVGYATDEDTLLTTGVVTGNDSDVDVGDSFSIVAWDAVSTAGALVADGGGGTFDYDPNGAFGSLAAGASATDTFTYTIEDGPGAQDTATVTVDITGVNDAPVLAAIGNQGLNEADVVAIPLTATDVDVPGNSLVFLSTPLPPFATLTDNGNGTGSLTLTPGFSDAGSYPVTITVQETDGAPSNLSDGESFTITVANVNRPPAPQNDTLLVIEDGSLVFTEASLLSNDTDPDGDAVLFDAITTSPANGTITPLGGGSYRLDPDPAYEGSDSFEYRVSDGSLFATATVDITVKPKEADLAVQLLSAAPNPVLQGVELTLGVQVSSAGPDPTGGTVVTIALPAGSAFVSATGGGCVGVAGPAVECTIGNMLNAQVETFDVDVTVGSVGNFDIAADVTASQSDPDLTDNSDTINVTVLANSPPTVTAAQSFSVSEDAIDTTVVGTVVATDPDSTIQSYTIVGGDPAGVFAIDASGQLTVADNTTLDRETTASYSLSITATDEVNTSAAETVTVDVTDVNDSAPVVGAGQSFSVLESAPDTTVVGTVTATDADTTPITGFSITAGNGDGIFGIDASGQITVVDNTNLDYETTTQYLLSVTATDGVNTSAAETVTVDVTDVNDSAPVVGAGQSFSVLESAPDTTVVGTVTATDADTTPITGFSITAGNGDGIFGIDASGQITVVDNTNLDYETTTQYLLSVTATDGVNTSAAETVTIDVTDVAEAAITFYLETSAPGDTSSLSPSHLPLITSAPTEGTLYNFDTDRNGDPGLTIRLSNFLPGSFDNTNADEYQLWGYDIAAPVAIPAAVDVVVWGALEAFNVGTGAIGVHLLDCDAGNSSCVIIDADLASQAQGAGWQQYTISLSPAPYTVVAGRRLLVRLSTPSGVATQPMMVAYAATPYPSRVAFL